MTTRYLRIVANVSPSVHLPTIVAVEPTSATLRHNPVDHRNARHSHRSWRVGRGGGRIWGGRRWWSSRTGRRRSRDRRKIHPTTTGCRPYSLIISRSGRRRSLSRSRSLIASMVVTIIAPLPIILIIATNIHISRALRSRFTRLLRGLQLGSKLRRRLLRLLGPQPRRTTVTTPPTAIRPPWAPGPRLHSSGRAEHVEFLRSRTGFLRVDVTGAAFPGARDED